MPSPVGSNSILYSTLVSCQVLSQLEKEQRGRQREKKAARNVFRMARIERLASYFKQFLNNADVPASPVIGRNGREWLFSRWASHCFFSYLLVSATGSGSTRSP